MSVGDWIVMGLLAPLLITGVWVVVVRVWLAGFRADAAVSWFTGEGRSLRGYHAALGPGVIGMTTGWAGYMLEQAFGISSYGEGPGATAVNVLYGSCLLFVALMFWMWLVQWPKFLVPPQHRD